jgi:hypothetical protein
MTGIRSCSWRIGRLAFVVMIAKVPKHLTGRGAPAREHERLAVRPGHGMGRLPSGICFHS